MIRSGVVVYVDLNDLRSCIVSKGTRGWSRLDGPNVGVQIVDWRIDWVDRSSSKGRSDSDTWEFAICKGNGGGRDGINSEAVDTGNNKASRNGGSGASVSVGEVDGIRSHQIDSEGSRGTKLVENKQ